jgi:mRNA-degrading endonuclease toxin of MazEF toxin-antitoxin module
MPERGAIYFIQIPGDPHQRPVPVAVVSTEARNRYGEDVLVIPLSTSPKRYETHLELPPGETGLPQPSIAKCENMHLLDKTLFEGRQPVSARRLSESRIRRMADLVALAMGVKR